MSFLDDIDFENENKVDNFDSGGVFENVSLTTEAIDAFEEEFDIVAEETAIARESPACSGRSIGENTTKTTQTTDGSSSAIHSGGGGRSWTQTFAKVLFQIGHEGVRSRDGIREPTTTPDRGAMTLPSYSSRSVRLRSTPTSYPRRQDTDFVEKPSPGSVLSGAAAATTEKRRTTARSSQHYVIPIEHNRGEEQDSSSPRRIQTSSAFAPGVVYERTDEVSIDMIELSLQRDGVSTLAGDEMDGSSSLESSLVSKHTLTSDGNSSVIKPCRLFEKPVEEDCEEEEEEEREERFVGINYDEEAMVENFHEKPTLKMDNTTESLDLSDEPIIKRQMIWSYERVTLFGFLVMSLIIAIVVFILALMFG